MQAIVCIIGCSAPAISVVKITDVFQEPQGGEISTLLFAMFFSVLFVDVSAAHPEREIKQVCNLL